MIRNSVVLLIVVIHCITPFSIKKVNVDCQCGCREWPCTCCRTSENSCDVTSVSKCRCDIHDESDIQSPATLADSPVMGFPLDRIGHVNHSNAELTLPGYEKPPMKPPPTA
jgi:hypothetical protein